jgi:hypothetical protein
VGPVTGTLVKPPDSLPGQWTLIPVISKYQSTENTVHTVPVISKCQSTEDTVHTVPVISKYQSVEYSLHFVSIIHCA